MKGRTYREIIKHDPEPAETTDAPEPFDEPEADFPGEHEMNQQQGPIGGENPNQPNQPQQPGQPNQPGQPQPNQPNQPQG